MPETPADDVPTDVLAVVPETARPRDRRSRTPHPAPPGPERAGRRGPPRHPCCRAHRAGRGHPRRLHDGVRPAGPADRPRRAHEREHRGLVVGLPDGGDRAEPRVPQGRPAQDRRGRGRPEGRGGRRPRDGRRHRAAARARTAAGPARLAAGRAEPAGQRHHGDGRGEHHGPGRRDPRRHPGPVLRDGGGRQGRGGARGEAARLRRGHPRRRRRPARPGRGRLRGVRGNPVERVARHLRAAVVGAGRSTPTTTPTPTRSPQRSAGNASRPRCGPRAAWPARSCRRPRRARAPRAARWPPRSRR